MRQLDTLAWKQLWIGAINLEVIDLCCPMWLLLATCGTLKLNQLNEIKNSVSRLLWLHFGTQQPPRVVATVLDSADIKHFYHHRSSIGQY